MIELTEEDTFHRLARKDFDEVFVLIVEKLSFTGAASDKSFSKYLLYAILYEEKEFRVLEDLYPVIEAAHWKPRDFLAEGQRRLDKAISETP